MGNLSGVRWADATLAVPAALFGLVVCLWHRRSLDAFTFGADSARRWALQCARCAAC